MTIGQFVVTKVKLKDYEKDFWKLRDQNINQIKIQGLKELVTHKLIDNYELMAWLIDVYMVRWCSGPSGE